MSRGSRGTGPARDQGVATRIVHAVVGVAILAAVPARGFAACGDEAADWQALAETRTQIEIACPCAAAITRASYRRCAVEVAEAQVRQGLLRAECREAIRRCSAKSPCGRPAFVACCLPIDRRQV